MKWIKDLIGISLIILAWINPLGLDITFRIVLFILGFDMTSLLLKFIVFVIDYFLGFFDLGWTLIILVVAELVANFIFFGYVIDYIVKPLAVFLVLYLNNLSIEIAIIVAGIDLLLNVFKRYR